MATGDTIYSGGYNGRVIQFSWSLNGSVINYSFTAVGGSASWYMHHNEVFKVNGSTVYTGSDSHKVYDGDVLKSGSISATASLSVQMNGGIYTWSDNIDTYQSWSVDVYAKITSAPNINLGDTATINISNPANQSIKYFVETLNPTQTILLRDAVNGNNTITFTDAELDQIYKKMGTGNSTALRFGVQTNNNYWDWLDRTCTLTGNQKTTHLKVSGSWKRGKTWIKVNGSWKRAIIWTNVNGTWKRCI